MVVVVLFLFELQAQARIYVVTDTNDTTKITSLRGAIIDANRHGGNNTIILGQQRSPRVYQLAISGGDEDAARTGDLDITRANLTIMGIGSNVAIDATGLGDRVFQVFPHASLTLENLTITGGTAPQAQFGSFYTPTKGAENGGAIYNGGVLMLKDCVITNNSSGGGNGNPGNGGGTSGGDGGGIYNSGTLTMANCIVAGNSSGTGADGASGGNGGGIKNDGACYLTDCVISENQSGAGGAPDGNAFGFGGSGGDGGGIYNSGTIVLNNCIVSVNTSGQGISGGDPEGLITLSAPGGWGGSGGDGSGIYNAGQMRLNFSAVDGNSCGNGGDGGSFGTGGNARAGGSGFGDFGGGASGTSGGGGGGIYNAGSLDLTSCTIALNQTGVGGNGGNTDRSLNNSSATSGGQGGDGGGILNDTSSTNVTMRNTLIALNTASAGGLGGTNVNDFTQQETIGDAGSPGFGPDLAGDFTSQKFNLIGEADDSTGFTNGMNADQVGSIASPINPLIGPLQMNGGPTPTHALLAGSPAVDQGKSFGVHTDQRGHHRPYNYTAIPNAPGGDGSDIGAFELGAR